MDRRVQISKVELPSSPWLRKAKLPDLGQVEDVALWRGGEKHVGTIHFSAHHMIFRFAVSKAKDSPDAEEKVKEMWITYPMVSSCTYRPSPPASHQPPTIRIRCRDFIFIAFRFQNDQEARAAYETIRGCTCKLGSLDKLLAFTYQNPREKGFDGWSLYDARREFARQGISPKSASSGWRISTINHDYTYSPTYPSVLVVPASISDNVLNYAKTYRSRARIPVLTYLHPINNASITRCSQPMVGVRQNRSAQDEKLVAAIWSTSNPAAVHRANKSAPGTPRVGLSTADLHKILDEVPTDTSSPPILSNGEKSDFQDIDDDQQSEQSEKAKVYGAQQQNLIVDARPTLNAYAMQAAGMGTENMDNYRGAMKEYFGIDNIHVMRKSLQVVIDAIKDADLTKLPIDREQLLKSKWLTYIGLLVDGGRQIAYRVGIHHSHVLVHCSDGWDRTSQLVSLAQLCLDPYFRTMEGFITLVEKDWLSFGHMFRHRTGHLSSEKWFEIENERISNNRTSLTSTQTGSGSGSAFENALSKAQGFFSKKSQESSDSDSEANYEPYSGKPSKALLEDKKYATIAKETSPMFHQFLDATYQIMHQIPTRFEFNERFLRRLLYHAYSCQYGTFLFDNEKERVEWKAKERTKSAWDHFLSNKTQYLNPQYDPVVDDNVTGKERIILPQKEKVRWWAEMFHRSDEEMNGPALPEAAPTLGPEINEPVVTGTEVAGQASGVGTALHPQPYRTSSPGRVTPSGQGRLNAGMARLALGGPPRESPRHSRETMEVEMQ